MRKAWAENNCMKKQTYLLAVTLLFAMLAPAGAQSIIAYDVPTPTNGNQWVKNFGVGNDFYVTRPVTLWHLGVFDHKGDGVKGEGTLTVQLFTRMGNRGSLLETMTFDGTSPGDLYGGQRFKSLTVPVTLLPGAYTIAAYGFDRMNPEGNAHNYPYSNMPPWRVNSGDGALRFEGTGRYVYAGPGHFPNVVGKGVANNFAAGTFTFTEAVPPTVPYAADYAALTAGVVNFPVKASLGSLAVFGRYSFPVLAEPGGRRLVLAAAGTYDGNSSAARCVVFAHTQFATSDDARGVLFDNAIRWASRKASPEETVVGLGPGLDPAPMLDRGYSVKLLTTNMVTADTDLSGCDVLVANWNVPFSQEAVEKVVLFNVAGGGMVMAVTPWAISYMVEHPEYVSAQLVLHPFGLALRGSQMQPFDSGITNIMATPWPSYFSAFPASDMLRAERQNRIQMSGFDKMMALGAINNTLLARPDLLCDLTGLCANPSAVGAGTASSFVDLTVMNGATAGTNRLGKWNPVGNTLVAQSMRGAVAYNFNLPADDVYRFYLEGGNGMAGSASLFPLVLSVNGIEIGSRIIQTTNQVDGRAEWMLPWLTAGAHTLRILWDNSTDGVSLRITRVGIQTGLGPDSDGDGTKDWVAGYLRQQSGLDITNILIQSYTSPLCLEGRDSYLDLMRCSVGTTGGTEPKMLNPQMAPNGRWFANAPLSQDPSKYTSLNVSYQNGGWSEARQLQWVPLDLLTASDMTVRQGDSLLLTMGTAAKKHGEMTFIMGTNQLPDLDGMPVPCNFGSPGRYALTGTWNPTGGSPQSRSITINVVGQAFPTAPVCWIGRTREWDMTNVPPQAVVENDDHIFLNELSNEDVGCRRFSLLVTVTDPKAIISRLGTNGPVLGGVTLKGINVFSSDQTYMRQLETYPDGTRLVETIVEADTLPPGVVIQFDIIVGGVTFEDGTTTLRLTAADFDALGQHKIRFLWPAGLKTSVCHTITIFQGNTIIGTR